MTRAVFLLILVGSINQNVIFEKNLYLQYQSLLGQNSCCLKKEGGLFPLVVQVWEILNQGRFKRFLIVGLLRAFTFQFSVPFCFFFVFYILKKFLNGHVNISIVPPLHCSTQPALPSFVYILSGHSLAVCVYLL